MRLFIFARHAESTANVLRLINSDPSRSIPLTARGQQQARDLGEQLSHLDIDEAVCTRFLRTHETASIALAGRRTPIRVDADLDEFDAGIFDGSPLEPYWRWKEAHPRSERFPGGESLDDAARRYATALRGLLGRTAAVTLVVCHELALRYIVEEAPGRPPNRNQRPIGNAVPFLFDEMGLRRALATLELLHAAERDDGAAAVG
jgi:2,3-bisphosphoglycerate-dependent phosphoglycerate mutase